jgi:hypothetical protein
LAIFLLSILWFLRLCLGISLPGVVGLCGCGVGGVGVVVGYDVGMGMGQRGLIMASVLSIFGLKK